MTDSQPQFVPCPLCGKDVPRVFDGSDPTVAYMDGFHHKACLDAYNADPSHDVVHADEHGASCWCPLPETHNVTRDEKLTGRELRLGEHEDHCAIGFCDECTCDLSRRSCACQKCWPDGIAQGDDRVTCMKDDLQEHHGQHGGACDECWQYEHNCCAESVKAERARIDGILTNEIHQWRSVRSSCQTLGTPTGGTEKAQAAIDALADVRSRLEGELREGGQS